VSDDIHVVDSHSTDNTLEICKRFGCNIVQRPFKNYSDQRNWAIDHLPLRHGWQLHVDADEELSPELVAAISRLDLENTTNNGWLLGRKIVFLGAVLRFGAIAVTWHYRLFRAGKGRCEERLYDQHFVPVGNVGKIHAFMFDHHEMTLSSWTESHNRWASLEAEEVTTSDGGDGASYLRIQPNRHGNEIEKRRHLKSRYYKLPLFLRAFAYFFYTYIFRLGFLDGLPGLIYYFLQGCWFRFLVDAKICEMRVRKGSGSEPS
jgi:glycosyltransferase involved in cell wall biosynthesis